MVVVGGGWWWCLNVNLVIGFGPSLGLALWPRAKPIKTNTDNFAKPIVDIAAFSRSLTGQAGAAV